MSKDPQFLLVDSSVVPTVFLKVLQAKRLLSKGLCKSSSEACKNIGISRSAFYKYKDSVYAYEDQASSKTVTFYLKLSDDPGVLSNVLQALYEQSANILTVNQNMPIDGVADVTVTIRMQEQYSDLRQMRDMMVREAGVIECRRI